ncbi:MAG: 16S rRNA (cytosine(1402)-N(4))-methyltransferase RsmH [Anaerolineae bacterium]|nr:16S rRNA (cytosine(1402)-N(4))-methyltransferase RsmH [Anaerolineae bacterium]
MEHQPVLYEEVVSALQPKDGGFYIDGTIGAGGHAAGILSASVPTGMLLGFDLDPQALALAKDHLTPYGERAILVRASYLQMAVQMQALEWVGVDGILLDLGLSSMQLNTPERGFSFRTDAPLDMRFDPDGEQRAADLVNKIPERDLADIIFRYGEEHGSRRIARAIVNARPIESTLALAEVVKRSIKKRHQRIHPATRTFQALRIATNRELDAVEAVLPIAIEALKPGGRLAVIAFHSLEDRMVKTYFRQASQNCICPPRQPICTCNHQAILNRINRKPIRPKEEEISSNPRARSARLRIAEKL